MKLYIDECGDLGFSSKATRFFVMSFLMEYNEWKPNIKLGPPSIPIVRII